MNWIVCGLIGAIGGPVLLLALGYSIKNPTTGFLIVAACLAPFVWAFVWAFVDEVCRHVFDPRRKAVNARWRAECRARIAREALVTFRQDAPGAVNGSPPTQLRGAVPDRRRPEPDRRPVPTGGPQWRAVKPALINEGIAEED